ncbi:MAG TPA: ATP-binding protein [Candidatus Saccharimonadales bacterium]|nr:ATP-binding protein [Candidatus Saccharimonadales bacterium]
MTKPLLIVFLGFPGSGKTYFSKQLADKLGAVTLNSDALRLSMFGSLEMIEQIRISDRARLYDDVFGAMDYAARQVLLANYSVIYDAQQTKRENRRNIEEIAHGSGAIPLLVWIKTSRETALKRGQEREARDDSHQYTAEKMEYFIDRFDSVTDLPEPTENTIEISGELTFEKQYLSFQGQLEKIISSNEVG